MITTGLKIAFFGLFCFIAEIIVFAHVVGKVRKDGYYKAIKIIDTTNAEDFETKVNEYLEQGYKIISSNIGFVNSDKYDFCSCYQAMMLKE